MLIKTENFWTYSVKDIMGMKYEDIKENIMKAAEPLTVDEIGVAVMERREGVESLAERLACCRILSALIDGPDVLEF